MQPDSRFAAAADLWSLDSVAENSVDLSRFDIPLSVVNADDPVGIVIRVHLHLEALLSALVEESLPFPAALDSERMSFATKTQIAVAMGVVADVAKAPLMQLNRVRNKLAHKLEASLTDSDADALEHSASFVEPARPRSDDDGPIPAAQRVALVAKLLQAWLNGVRQGRIAPRPLTKQELEIEAAKRYPLPDDPQAPDNGFGAA